MDCACYIKKPTKISFPSRGTSPFLAPGERSRQEVVAIILAATYTYVISYLSNYGS